MFTILNNNRHNIKAIASRDSTLFPIYGMDCGTRFFANILAAEGISLTPSQCYKLSSRVARMDSGRTMLGILVETNNDVQDQTGLIILVEYAMELSAIARYFRELGWTALAGLLKHKSTTATPGLETGVGFQELTEISLMTDHTPETDYSGVLRTLGFEELTTTAAGELETVYSILYPSGCGLVHDHFRHIRCMS